MNVAVPGALFWAAAMVPVILLFLVKARPRVVAIGADQFWEQVFTESRRRAAWRRLRDPLALLIQLLILGLLVLAIAEPFTGSQVAGARRVVLVLDNSAALSATDVSPSRWSRARDATRRVLRGLGHRDEAALVMAATAPRIAVGLTDDHRVLARALDTVPVTDGPRRLSEAVTLARRLLAGHPRGEIIVITDGAGDDQAWAGPDVRAVTVGRATGNLAITRFQARRRLSDPTGYELLVEIANLSDEPATARLEIEHDGVPVDVLPVELPADGLMREVLSKASPEGGRFTARLDRDDALMTDNVAVALLPPREPVPVRLVTPGNRFADLYVEKVLEANALVQSPLSVLNDPARASGGPGVTVFHQQVPAPLPQGPVFVIDPGGGSDLWTVTGLVDAPVVTRVDRESPLTAHVRLENVALSRVRRVVPRVPARVIVEVAGDPLLAVWDRPEGRVVLLAAELEETDLPLRTAFPILAANALGWLVNHGADYRESVSAGGFAEIDLPSDPAGLRLWPPNGSPRPLAVRDGRARIGPLDQQGVWRIATEAEGPVVAEVACNLASARDSDLRVAREALAPPPESVGIGGFPIWLALAALAAGMLIVEWFLFQRRWIG